MLRKTFLLKSVKLETPIDTTPRNRLVTEISLVYHDHRGGTDDSQNSPNESFLTKHSLLMASVIGSVGLIISVLIVTAFVYR